MELPDRLEALFDRCRRGDLGGIEDIPDVGEGERLALLCRERVRLALRQLSSFSLRLGRHTR